MGALLRDFERAGLALSDAERADLQALQDADAAACNGFKTAIGPEPGCSELAVFFSNPPILSVRKSR